MHHARLARLFIGVALWLAVENTAHADGPVVSESPPPPPSTTPVWYGWQTLAADGASAALLGTGAAWAGSGSSGNGTAAPVLLVGGLGGVALGGPIVHLAHGHPLRALADLGLRVSAVTLGGFVGGEIVAASTARSGCQNNDVGCLPQTLGGVALGALVGTVAASAIDAAVLSYDEPARPPASVSAFSWSPSVSMLKNGGAVGLTGTF